MYWKVDGMTDNNKQREVLSELIVKCWDDNSFKESFMKEPKKYLVEAGINIDDTITIKAVEQTETVNYMILPAEINAENMQKTMAEIFNKMSQKDFKMPDGAELRIVQNTETMSYIYIPLKRETDELGDADLDSAAGGYGCIPITIAGYPSGGIVGVVVSVII